MYLLTETHETEFIKKSKVFSSLPEWIETGFSLKCVLSFVIVQVTIWNPNSMYLLFMQNNSKGSKYFILNIGLRTDIKIVVL